MKWLYATTSKKFSWEINEDKKKRWTSLCNSYVGSEHENTKCTENTERINILKLPEEKTKKEWVLRTCFSISLKKRTAFQNVIVEKEENCFYDIPNFSAPVDTLLLDLLNHILFK